MIDKKVDEPTALGPPPRHWVRLTSVYLLIAAIPLILGGAVGWWQAWVFGALIVLAGVGGRVLAERRHPGLMAEREEAGFEDAAGVKPWDRVLAPLMAISLTFPIIIVAGLDHRFGWSAAFPLGLNLLGILLIGTGYAIGVWAIVENRFFSSMVRIQTDRGHGVCDSGPYRLLRHPGYAGNILALPGIVLALSSVWAVIPAVFAVVIAVLRTALEDRTLQEELPGYQAYARRVRYRLLPPIY